MPKMDVQGQGIRNLEPKRDTHTHTHTHAFIFFLLCDLDLERMTLRY